MSPEKAAQAILAGVRRNRFLVYTSFDVRFGYWWARKFALPYEIVMRVANDRFDRLARISSPESSSRTSAPDGSDATPAEVVAFDASGAPAPPEAALAGIDTVALRAHITEKFRVEFKKGVDSYIAGKWGKARTHLEKCVKLNPHVGGDGPSQTLLGFMGGHRFQAPVDWPGYRALTSK